MGAEDKAENKGEQATGKAKEGIGKATGNDSLKNEGKKDQAKGSAKEAGEDIKDSFKDGPGKR